MWNNGWNNANINQKIETLHDKLDELNTDFGYLKDGEIGELTDFESSLDNFVEDKVGDLKKENEELREEIAGLNAKIEKITEYLGIKFTEVPKESVFEKKPPADDESYKKARKKHTEKHSSASQKSEKESKNFSSAQYKRK